MPAYTYKKLISIHRDHLVIQCKEKIISIPLAECVQNYGKETESPNLCVGTRDITKLKFTFYTNPKTEIFLKKPTFFPFGWYGLSQKFRQLQNAIVKAGYRTFDLS